MRDLRIGLAWLAVLAFVTLPVASQSAPCNGPNSASPVTPCSQALTPEQSARYFLEDALAKASTPTAPGLAAALESEAERVCVQPPQNGTVGLLYGIARWGCENGYSFRYICQGTDYYYLEKEVDADYGYVVVHHVVVSAEGWNVFALDSTTPVTVVRSDAGDVKLSVVLSLRQKSTATGAPVGYTDMLRAQYRGQATNLKIEILAYCSQYKKDYCQELSSLAALLTRSVPATSGAPAVRLSIAASAAQHLSATVPLELSTDAMSLLVVTGTVFDDRGLPVADAEVGLTGGSASAHTASDGSYRISSFGTGTTLTLRHVDVTLQRATVDLSIKTTGATPVVGIAADGVSRLTIAVSSHGVRPDSVTVATPTVGEFERASSGASPLSLDKDGNGTLVYVPPNALSNEALTETLLIGGGSAPRSVPAAPVSFTVRFVDLDGVSRTSTISIRVCRPPVLLVQSYLGGTATWTQFADSAKIRRLDCQIVGEGVTWSPGNVSLADWAKDLASRLSDARAAYEASGIQIGAVDVVAHSLAGLVVRSLLEGANPRKDVHKLILVGVPNRGMAWLDQEVGAAATRWLAAHPTAAAEVYEGSAFLRGLDPDNSAGRKTLYVNLVGRRPPSLSASRQGSSTVQDDGIVSAASSHLDGVPDVRFDGVVHAPGLLPNTPALTESPDVWSSIFDLLTGEVPHADADALQIELRRGKLVSTSIDAQATPWVPVTKFSSPLGDSLAVRTGDKGYAAIAVVHAGEAWGFVSLDAKTEIILRASSPSLIRIEVVSGRARFRAQEDATAGDFEVVLDAATRSGSWYTTQPDARTLGVSGDFVVGREETSSVLALAGTVIVEYSKGTGFSPARLVEGGTGIRVRATGIVEDEKLPARGWWTLGVWSEPIPFFYFPIWIMALSLAGLAAAVAYHVRMRRSLAERPRAKTPPPGRSS